MLVDREVDRLRMGRRPPCEEFLDAGNEVIASAFWCDHRHSGWLVDHNNVRILVEDPSSFKRAAQR
jgi:hypothetical protein